MPEQLLAETISKMLPDYNKKCLHCETKMVVVVVPGTKDSWMYNCLNVNCPCHEPNADVIF